MPDVFGYLDSEADCRGSVLACRGPSAGRVSHSGSPVAAGLAHLTGMKCLGEIQMHYNMKANERWVLLNKDTFQEIFNATLHEMTKNTSSGNEIQEPAAPARAWAPVKDEHKSKLDTKERQSPPSREVTAPRTKSRGPAHALLPPNCGLEKASSLTVGSDRKTVAGDRHLEEIKAAQTCPCQVLQDVNLNMNTRAIKELQESVYMLGNGYIKAGGPRIMPTFPPNHLRPSPHHMSAMQQRDSEPLDLSYKRSDDEGEVVEPKEGGPAPSISPVSSLGSPASSTYSSSGRETPDYNNHSVSQASEKRESRQLAATTSFSDSRTPPASARLRCAPSDLRACTSRGLVSKYSAGRLDRISPVNERQLKTAAVHSGRGPTMKRGGENWAPFSKASLCDLVEEVVANMDNNNPTKSEQNMAGPTTARQADDILKQQVSSPRSGGSPRSDRDGSSPSAGGQTANMAVETVSETPRLSCSTANVTAASSPAVSCAGNSDSGSVTSQDKKGTVSEEENQCAASMGSPGASCASNTDAASTTSTDSEHTQCWMALNKMVFMEMVDSAMGKMAGENSPNANVPPASPKQGVSTRASPVPKGRIPNSSSNLNSAQTVSTPSASLSGNSTCTVTAKSAQGQPNNNTNAMTKAVEAKELIRQRLTAMESQRNLAGKLGASHHTEDRKAGSRAMKRSKINGGDGESPSGKKRKGRHDSPVNNPSSPSKQAGQSPGTSMDTMCGNNNNTKNPHGSPQGTMQQHDAESNYSLPAGRARADLVTNTIGPGRNSPQLIDDPCPKAAANNYVKNGCQRTDGVSEDAASRLTAANPLTYSLINDKPVVHLGPSQGSFVVNDSGEKFAAKQPDIKGLHAATPFIRSQCSMLENNQSVPGDTQEKSEAFKSAATRVLSPSMTDRGKGGVVPEAKQRSPIGAPTAGSSRMAGRDARSSPKLGWVAVSKADVHTIFDSVVDSMMADDNQCDLTSPGTAAAGDQCPTVPSSSSENLPPKRACKADDTSRQQSVPSLTHPSAGDGGSMCVQHPLTCEADPSGSTPARPCDQQASYGRSKDARSNNDQQPNSDDDVGSRCDKRNNNVDDDNSMNGDVSSDSSSTYGVTKSPESPRCRKAFKWKNSLLERVNEEKESNRVPLRTKHLARGGPSSRSGRRHANSNRKASSHK